MGQDYMNTKMASHVYLLRERDGAREVLLQLRGKGSRAGAGTWDATAAGHLEEGESLIQCAQRELVEEAGASFDEGDIEFLTCIHRLTEDVGPYFNIHLFLRNWSGEPRVCEFEKAEELRWFALDDLPKNLFADRAAALHNYVNKIPYSESGWAS